MLCYRDMTFCASPNCVNACGRKLSEKEKSAIPKWLGVAYGNFCDAGGSGGPGVPVMPVYTEFCEENK